MSLGPGLGCPKSTGGASFCASPGKAASSSAFFMPQRAVRPAGGGAGIVVGVVGVLVVAGATRGRVQRGALAQAEPPAAATTDPGHDRQFWKSFSTHSAAIPPGGTGSMKRSLHRRGEGVAP